MRVLRWLRLQGFRRGSSGPFGRGWGATCFRTASGDHPARPFNGPRLSSSDTESLPASRFQELFRHRLLEPLSKRCAGPSNRAAPTFGVYLVGHDYCSGRSSSTRRRLTMILNQELSELFHVGARRLCTAKLADLDLGHSAAGGCLATP